MNSCGSVELKNNDYDWASYGQGLLQQYFRKQSVLNVPPSVYECEVDL